MTNAVPLVSSVPLAAALALAGCGGGSSSPTTPGTALTTRTFANEVVVSGGGRDFMIDTRGSGTLSARVDWVQDGAVLGMYIVNHATPSQVLVDGGQTGARQLTLSLPVSAGTYRIAVTNSSGLGAHVDTTFTLTVMHP